MRPNGNQRDSPNSAEARNKIRQNEVTHCPSPRWHHCTPVATGSNDQADVKSFKRLYSLSTLFHKGPAYWYMVSLRMALFDKPVNAAAWSSFFLCLPI
jgi:hypothetical protein